jgi:DNA oxidative demethylase
MLDLFDTRPSHERITDGAYLLRGFVLDIVTALVAEVEHIETVAPFRHLETPGGYRMSVAMTNCGAMGWVSGASRDSRPQTGRPRTTSAGLPLLKPPRLRC